MLPPAPQSLPQSPARCQEVPWTRGPMRGRRVLVPDLALTPQGRCRRATYLRCSAAEARIPMPRSPHLAAARCCRWSLSLLRSCGTMPVVGASAAAGRCRCGWRSPRRRTITPSTAAAATAQLGSKPFACWTATAASSAAGGEPAHPGVAAPHWEPAAAAAEVGDWSLCLPAGWLALATSTWSGPSKGSPSGRSALLMPVQAPCRRVAGWGGMSSDPPWPNLERLRIAGRPKSCHPQRQPPLAHPRERSSATAPASRQLRQPWPRAMPSASRRCHPASRWKVSCAVPPQLHPTRWQHSRDTLAVVVQRPPS